MDLMDLNISWLIVAPIVCTWMAWGLLEGIYSGALLDPSNYSCAVSVGLEFSTSSTVDVAPEQSTPLIPSMDVITSPLEQGVPITKVEDVQLNQPLSNLSSAAIPPPEDAVVIDSNVSNKKISSLEKLLYNPTMNFRPPTAQEQDTSVWTLESLMGPSSAKSPSILTSSVEKMPPLENTYNFAYDISNKVSQTKEIDANEIAAEMFWASVSDDIYELFPKIGEVVKMQATEFNGDYKYDYKMSNGWEIEYKYVSSLEIGDNEVTTYEFDVYNGDEFISLGHCTWDETNGFNYELI